MSDLFSVTVDNTKFSAVEMIATIIGSRASGKFGECVRLDDGGLRITLVNGLTVIAYRGRLGEHCVQFKGLTGIDTNAENAVKLALDAGRGVSATRNVKIC